MHTTFLRNLSFATLAARKANYLIISLLKVKFKDNVLFSFGVHGSSRAGRPLLLRCSDPARKPSEIAELIYSLPEIRDNLLAITLVKILKLTFNMQIGRYC